MFDNPKVLVLFSGGKDSFLSAARLVEKGYEVHLMFFNNGSVVYEEHVLHGVERLQGRYGKDCIKFDGYDSTVSTLWTLNSTWTYETWRELGDKYPLLSNAQVTCLHCQTAMWVNAIAFAIAHSIPNIASGYKNTDEFCTGVLPWIQQISKLTSKYNINMLMPLWETPEWGENKDYGRDTEMIQRFFQPAVLEPKCMLGRPVEKPYDGQISGMMRYFEDVILNLLPGEIERKVQVFKWTRKSYRSLESMCDYNNPLYGTTEDYD